MNNQLKGSDLTRALLARGDKKIWCAVCDDSDEQAMMDHGGNDFTAYIVSFHEGCFYCSAGMPWGYAVPIKVSAVMQLEVSI
ncbi:MULTISPECIES: hypothetical protein [unclassified Psychrobacter]|uniref:hypothetical protein n=1 Tax=unclassified Psychrobacter TaxID=196806 RepID=UPI0025B487DE|nr:MULTISPECIES: hypothetical protein [unclassified Psychrobacter]MDN3453575.1 hypothetical protein [Psychrobacter sp. APC 3350]MDN3502179.1 hypothetical protein [Psychrobacter sp. 5A.1]